ncbi:DUF1513 domain-containing protein [Halopseudomonas pelagia]|uniref:DUF1513 domain-containing protein n=1 Tax=Halopseudomonas pelagia TaxID=553151 RepID=UPI00039C64D0|nr:DUF1513 domain-containing protein [Halopseudomonas pelagia]|tara:strand:- start:59903 stop:61009 length:1107 start_codon:yes stop_codon:yes gene_type:complete
MDRRHFIKLSLAGLVLTSPLVGCAVLPAGNQPQRFLSAVDTVDGRHFIMLADNQGRILASVPVAERCHGGCIRPGSTQVAVFARRPGRALYILDSQDGTLQHQLSSGEQHHFYGHGVFSQDGQYLYATANHFSDGQGHIRVYDAQQQYRWIADFSVGGMDPHELRLHPDGTTLVIAMGGILTHPDYDRIKLNLDSMRPALVLMNSQTGALEQKHEPSHHQLSCHHLAISSDGIVIAGYQFEGPAWEHPPLIARLDTTSGRFSEIELPLDRQAAMRNYVASVAISPGGSLAAITAPRGNRVVIVDYVQGRYVQDIELPDAAGVLAADQGGFLVTSGVGGIYHIDERTLAVTHLSAEKLRWDNHLTALSC